MTNLTTAITEIKTRVSLQEWQQRILDCQNSGMSVKAWCQANGISTGSYYFHLRKIRESVLEENQIILKMSTQVQSNLPNISERRCRERTIFQRVLS